MTQNFSGLLKIFQIAILPSYWGFSLCSSCWSCSFLIAECHLLISISATAKTVYRPNLSKLRHVNVRVSPPWPLTFAAVPPQWPLIIYLWNLSVSKYASVPALDTSCRRRNATICHRLARDTDTDWLQLTWRESSMSWVELTWRFGDFAEALCFKPVPKLSTVGLQVLET